MTSNSQASSGRAGSYWYFVLIALALVVLPLVLDQRILVSPILLFGAACVSTVANHVIRGTSAKDADGMYSRVFYLRLGVSIAAVFLLLAIDYIARAFAA
ncbi:hypothetical protein [Massilia sp. H6]|uniref:hypothetical protein n=1 Tax=Massilia sp. H6 TaxID=2970464 RepID=UPI002168A38C|nr:hypothetical protein [Massilia sp. H6]UVW28494.1 hypothetical protein NRS07_18590 [Massilia sp. H6]